MHLRWKAVFLTLVSFLFPLLAFADDAASESFAPPTSDLSVTFLGNLFGMVDGVLHSTGSQIMGVMFGVFNAGLLSLGGIVIMYIILVSTMNTAHEGQMLGQKWSSIWVPVRAVIGLALLIPKASGYCMMQVFVMWTVLQGVGVADKIWGAALDYMNRGGVIIQADMKPSTSMNAGGSSVMSGAATILYGQVCMLGLQTQLENLRTGYLNAKDNGSGECSGTPSATMKAFCNFEVEDFMNSVSPISFYNDTEGNGGRTAAYQLPMPNFKSDSIYYSLNGVCGTINWNPLNTETSKGMRQVDKQISTLSESDMQTIEASRAAAIEQMYTSLSTTARSMVNNDPQINTSLSTDDEESVVALDQFGVPLSAYSNICQSMSDDCPLWGPYSQSTTAVLLDGTELQEAVEDYNAVMAPTVNLMNEAKKNDSANDERKFISEAKSRGWIMAGSYFFDLVRLNGSADAATKTDTDTGLDGSTFDTQAMKNAFGQSGCDGDYALLCTLFTYTNPDPVNNVANLIDGTGIANAPSTAPNYKNMDSDTQFAVVKSPGASTVYGYAYNAAFLDLPGQESTGTNIKLKVAIDYTIPKLSDSPKLTCSKINLGFVKFKDPFCMAMNQVIWVFWEGMFQWVTWAITYAVQIVLNILIIEPLQNFVQIFQSGMDMLDKNGVNPITALAKVGLTFLNFSMDTYLVAAIAAAVGSFNPAVFALMTMSLPIFFAWLGVMVGIGMLMAYYIPFLPYMIFTFGTIAWFISVIEAMVAAPIVALGVAHPEGHDALGKSEQGLMILLNVFLRPGMMIIGYISAIALSFVGVWVMNAGFGNVFNYLESANVWGAKDTVSFSDVPWGLYFGEFFGALIYVMMYLTIVEKAFNLIAVLPDKVLRWIGGQPENAGQEAMQWTEQAKGKIGEAGKATQEGGGQAVRKVMGHMGQAVAGKGDSGGGKKDVSMDDKE